MCDEPDIDPVEWCAFEEDVGDPRWIELRVDEDGDCIICIPEIRLRFELVILCACVGEHQTSIWGNDKFPLGAREGYVQECSF